MTDEYDNVYEMPAQESEPPTQEHGLNRQFMMQYSNEHLLYLRSITDDDTFKMIETWLLNAKLKIKTLDNMLLFLIESFSQEYVLNYIPGYSYIRKEYLTHRSVTLRMSISALEYKYLDAALILKIIEKHHMNKYHRSVRGFERETQHTSINKVHQETKEHMETPEPKAGLNKYIGGGKQL